MSDQIRDLAERYVRQFGDRALARIADDISIATARCDWPAVLALTEARRQIGGFK
ncbi:hypothetical protein [Sphingomonas nostoxanthinifaciens]|uniref:hypothetical protein n=1 Tax=Sphingomonas nostoxanthinifaciens TaxID=2872652 RepID=UPI001CC1C7BB|nr:hypothetical protein [Sphingomonas nostoxanthinifaciens]UAK23145.1 hypothetical protein K8P63_12040 [Sphingomonas nostoxanthinifaciens]